MGNAWRTTMVAGIVAATMGLSACAPLLIGAAATMGTLSALDRRTLGAQTEDQLIELKGVNRLRESMRNVDAVGVTSFNRKVLLTGQVLTEQDKVNAQRVIATLDNVRSIENELQVSGRVSTGVSASDGLITTRVKSALIDSKRVQANTVKVVTEASVVYLMGVVTRDEGERAAEIASRVSGVGRVVTVFEYVSDEDLVKLRRDGTTTR